MFAEGQVLFLKGITNCRRNKRYMKEGIQDQRKQEDRNQESLMRALSVLDNGNIEFTNGEVT